MSKYYLNIFKIHLTKIHVAGMMYSVLCQKFHLSIRTIHEFSIAIRELVLLANSCINPKVDFLITLQDFEYQS